MAGIENKQPVSNMSSVSAARETQSTTPPCTRGRPKSRFSTTVTGNSSDSDNSSSRTGTYRIEVGDRLATTGHMDETVLHSVDDVQPVKLAFPLPVVNTEVTTEAIHTTAVLPIGPISFLHHKVPELLQ